MKPRKGDFIIALTVVLIACIMLAAFSVNAVSSPMFAVGSVNGKEVFRYLLPYSGSIDVKGGEYALTVEFENNRARVSVSDCPDNLCVGSGWLDRSGACSVCLPAGFVLRLVSADGADVDAVTGQ